MECLWSVTNQEFQLNGFQYVYYVLCGFVFVISGIYLRIFLTKIYYNIYNLMPKSKGFWTSLVQIIMFKRLSSSILLVTNTSSSEDEESETGVKLPLGLERELMPRHVALILDGSRRWAKQRRLKPTDGYKAGLETIIQTLTLCAKWEIPIVSMFFFSSENWRRPKEEVSFLLDAFEKALKEGLYLFSSLGAKLSVIGEIELFPTTLQEAIKQAEEATKNNTKLHMIIAMSYSGQNDITQACQKIAAKVKDGVLEIKDITKSVIEQELHTKVTDIPSPDLLIRSSGELRISNYYLWQLGYSEMYFTDALWPDFDEHELAKALLSFQKRGRRFGMN